MSTKPQHLVERAAEYLLHFGLVADPTTQSSPVEHRAASCRPALDAPAAAAQDIDRKPLSQPSQNTNEPSPVPPRSIVSIAALEHAGLFDWSGGRRRTLEEFRLAQRQLLRAAFADTGDADFANFVMVTSARPGEGKSFVSLNLACSIALQGDHDVLLIDCDPNWLSITQTLGLADPPGILDLAANSSLSADDCILPTEVEHLSVLPIGRERERSSELFASRDMAHLLRRLDRSSAKRVLILDTGPCLSTSDPAALAPAVGQILMVVQAERTQREEVETALELLRSCPSITLMLNRAYPSNRHPFGAYSGSHAS